MSNETTIYKQLILEKNRLNFLPKHVKNTSFNLKISFITLPILCAINTMGVIGISMS